MENTLNFIPALTLDEAMQKALQMMGYKQMKTYWFKPMAYSCLIYDPHNLEMHRLVKKRGVVESIDYAELKIEDLGTGFKVVEYIKKFEAALTHDPGTDFPQFELKDFGLDDINVILP
jgi:hypothetical protein